MSNKRYTEEFKIEAVRQFGAYIEKQNVDSCFRFGCLQLFIEQKKWVGQRVR